MHRFRNFLLENKIVPKWLIFVLDLFICGIAVLAANALRFNFDWTVFRDRLMIDDVIIVIATNSLLFYLFRTYEGIIRFSGLAEALRTIGALFLSFFILLSVNAVMTGLEMHNPIATSVLFIYFFTASFLIVGYRLLVKGIYKRSLNTGDATNVVIYGGELNGMQLKNTIEQISNFTYRVIAFIDDDPNFIGKSIDNVKIHSFDQIKNVMRSWNIGMLLFAKPEMEVAEKNAIVEYCLEHDINVRNIPPVDEWIQGHLSISQLKEIKIEELLGRPPINLKIKKVEDLLKSKRILITGAAGSIGSEIARQVAGIQPSLLILCDQTETGLHDLEYELKNVAPNCAVVLHIGDIRDAYSMENLFERFQPNIVFHAAAYKHVPIMEFHPSEAIRNNVLGTKVLADLSLEFGVERFLLISTDKAINPTNIMGASKRIAEIYVQSLGNRSKKVVHLTNNNQDGTGSKTINKNTHGATKFITTRFGNVLGSNGSVIPRFKEQIANGGPVTVTHPEIIRFFMTIPESCSLVLEAVTMGVGSEVFIFDMGEPVKIIDLAKKMIRLSGLIPGKDIEIKYTGLRPGEKLYEELLNKSEQVIPTHHSKILIAKVMEHDFYEINKSIDDLIQKAIKNEDEEVVRKMKYIVPEFISNNSIYQSFDEINPNPIAVSK